MSDDKLKVGLELEVKASGEDQIKKIDNDLQNIERRAKAIAASIRAAAGVSSNPGRGRTGADPVRAARDALAIDRDRLRVLKMQMGFEAKARADLERAARQQARGDERRYRLSMAFNDRMFRQQRTEQARTERAESAARARQVREEEQANRRQIAFTGRMFAQRAREEAAFERDRERVDRQRIRLDNYRMRLRAREDQRITREQDTAQSRFRSRGRDAVDHGRDAYHRLTRPPAYAAAAGAAGTAAIARRAIGAEVDIDSAEINARIYGNLSKDAARNLRDKWAAPLAENLGVSTAKLLTSYTDALKIGIPEAGAQQFSELATKASEAWGVAFETVTDTFGTVNSILTSTGESFDFNKIKGVANTLQHLAAKQSTTPEKLIEFLKQGAGGSQVLGMSQEAGLAFGSASTSLGNQAGESGRLLDYMASRVVELPNLVRKKGDEGRHARDLMRELGYGTAENMDRSRRADPDAFLPDFMERFNTIADPKKQDQAIRFFAGREWLGEFGRLVKGNSTFKEATKLAQEAKDFDAIENVWSLHKQKLSFVLKRIRTGFVNILGEFGKVLSPLATQFGDYFLDWSRKLQGGGLKARINAVIEGFIAGLGFQDLPDLLRGFFGTPGQGDPGAVSQWRASAKAFAEGIRDVFGSVKSVIGAFTGGDPEVIARWTGRILALSAALFVLGPVLTVLGGFVSLIATLASIVSAVGAVKGLAGVAGSAGAAGAAGGIAGAAIWTAIGGVIGTAFLAKVANSLGILKAPDLSKGLGRSVLEFLDPGLASKIYGGDKAAGQSFTDTPSTWQDPPDRSDKRTLQEKQLDELARIRKFAEEQAKAEKELSEKKDGLSSLLHKSSADDYASNQWTKFGRGQLDRFQDGLTRIPNEARSLDAGSWRGPITGGPLSGSVGGGALGGSGLSRRGILGGGSFNPGGAEASSAPGRGSANHMKGQYGAPGSNLTTITTASGRKVTVHRAAAENFRGFLNELEGSGYKINSLGGYNYRNVRGGSRLSQHAYGNAIDINPAQNPMGPRLVTDMPKNVSDMAAKWGLTWGGDWKRRPDAMHFEWNGKTLDQLKREGPGAVDSGDRSTAGGLTSVIERAAAAAGIDPRIMHGIRAGESGHRADYDRNVTPREESYGPFQLNRKGGLGTVFERETGLDLKDPRTIPQQAAWVAQHIRKKMAANPRYNPGSEWYGYKGRMQSDPRWGDSGLVEAAQKANEKSKNLADGFTSTGWRKVEPGGSITARTPLGTTTPIKPGNTQPIGGPRPAPSSGGSSGGGAAPIININGHNGDPESLANTVQRRLQEGMSRRSHDVDHIYT